HFCFEPSEKREFCDRHRVPPTDALLPSPEAKLTHFSRWTQRPTPVSRRLPAGDTARSRRARRKEPTRGYPTEESQHGDDHVSDSGTIAWYSVARIARPVAVDGSRPSCQRTRHKPSGPARNAREKDGSFSPSATAHFWTSARAGLTPRAKAISRSGGRSLIPA